MRRFFVGCMVCGLMIVGLVPTIRELNRQTAMMRGDPGTVSWDMRESLAHVAGSGGGALILTGVFGFLICFRKQGRFATNRAAMAIVPSSIFFLTSLCQLVISIPFLRAIYDPSGALIPSISKGAWRGAQMASLLVAGAAMFFFMWRLKRSVTPATEGPHCGDCGYSLEGLPGKRCPECGTSVDELPPVYKDGSGGPSL